jgi:hypothetical protein
MGGIATIDRNDKSRREIRSHKGNGRRLLGHDHYSNLCNNVDRAFRNFLASTEADAGGPLSRLENGLTCAPWSSTRGQ